MSRDGAAISTDPIAADGGRDALARGGSAADAVVAGFLAAAGANPAVLLSPAVAIVAGAGAGARAFDGRSLQPGKGAARPRGFVDGAAVPDSARFAVPRSVAMLLLLHSYFGRLRLGDLNGFGLRRAEECDAIARGRVIEAIGRAGALALRAEDVVRALVAAGGDVQGGVLTADDLEATLPGEASAVVQSTVGNGVITTSPWTDGSGAAEIIAVVDGRGMAAALAYRPDPAGVAVPELGLIASRDAVPVMRGVQRLAPGSPLASPAPVAIVAVSPLIFALGIKGPSAIDSNELVPLGDAEARVRIPIDGALKAMRARLHADEIVAAIAESRGARWFQDVVASAEPTARSRAASRTP